MAGSLRSKRRIRKSRRCSPDSACPQRTLGDPAGFTAIGKQPLQLRIANLNKGRTLEGRSRGRTLGVPPAGRAKDLIRRLTCNVHRRPGDRLASCNYELQL
jgi:hypothetical protein